MSRSSLGSPCYCGQSRSYPLCCQPIVERRTEAATAEALMRSRYSAFCAQATDYLLYSWDPATRPPQLILALNREWMGLEILSTHQGGAADSVGTVEFKATFSDDGVVGSMIETSEFRREMGRWVYTKGQLTP